MPWDRLPSETNLAYSAFRQYRDLGPRRTVHQLIEISGDSARKWSIKHHWAARSTAWDDEVARVEDLDRLDALRTMHGNHARAARALQGFAMQALAGLDAQTTSAADIARLFELGARLERLTLSQSVEELQGRTPHHDTDDPWTRIADGLASAAPDYIPG